MPGVVAVYWRWIVQLTAAMAILTLMLVGALNLEPYRYPSGVTAILPDTNCEPACVMGIQPGVTPAEDAMAILHAHSLVADVHRAQVVGDKVRVSWAWHHQMAVLADAPLSFLIYGLDGKVTAIHIKTTLDPATFRVGLDRPATIYRVFADSGQFAHIIEAYPALHTDVYYIFDCTTRQPSGAEFMVSGEQITRPYSTTVTGYVQNRCREAE